MLLKNSIRSVSDNTAAKQTKLPQAKVVRKILTALEQAAPLQFQISLRMRNFDELEKRAARGELISPAEKQAKYFPLASDYQKVANWARAQGFVVTQEDPARLAIFVRAPIRQITARLKCAFARVDMDKEEWTSATTPPEVPDDIAALIVGIQGLQPHLRLRPHLFRPDNLTSTAAPFTVSQIAHAYGIDTLHSAGIKGNGQSIAIIADAYPATSDLTSFWNTYSVAQSLSNFSFIHVGTDPLPGPSGEETLDAEIISGLAPSAKIRCYATSALTFTAVDLAYQQVYNDAVNHPEYHLHSLNLSFGAGELAVSSSQYQTDAQYVANLASAGVSVFASSGDTGAYLSMSGTKYLQVSEPASLPSVTGVGGTSLTLNSDGSVNTETSWNLSGGGASIYTTRPSYQATTGVPPGSARTVPDVGALGDPSTGALYVLNGQAQPIGGTSLSVLIWSASAALVEQKRATASLSPLGNWNSRLYALIGSSNFRDITTGTNNGFFPKISFDPITGMGVPQMQNLIPAMSGAPVTSPFPGARTATLHTFFDGGTPYDGRYPSSLTRGPDDSFYGICGAGGKTLSGYGAVFKLSPDGTYTILHFFNDGSVTNDGNSPTNGVVVDATGNVYGMTLKGGAYGDGAVYKITPAGTTTTLYSFQNISGSPTVPTRGLVLGGDGNIYGISANGYFWKITPSGTFTTITSSLAPAGGGSVNWNVSSYSRPLLGSDGNFYGTVGSSFYRLTPAGVMTVLHTITNAEGSSVRQLYFQDSDGNFYGSCDVSPGNFTGGALFKITPSGTYTILHDFTGTPAPLTAPLRAD